LVFSLIPWDGGYNPVRIEAWDGRVSGVTPEAEK
jgi:hypothetical protein